MRQLNASEPRPDFITRRDFLQLGAAGLAALLAACSAGSVGGQPSASLAAKPGTQPQVSAADKLAWDQLVAAGVKEGAVNVYAGQAAGLKEFTDAFESAFPAIKVSGTFGPGNDIASKLTTEHLAKKFIADVIISLDSQSVITLKPAGVVTSLEPALALPEVRDPSLWLGNHLWWVDSTPPNTTLSFQGLVYTTIFCNTSVVDTKQFKSLKDLLDPRWKGKIVANDIRRPGPGLAQIKFIYSHPDLGPSFVQRLFGDTGITLATDQRQMVDWVGQGKYSIGLWLSAPLVAVAAAQGVPIAPVPGAQTEEATLITPSGGSVALADSAPHPKAVQVFINWLLSREGQLAWQQTVKQPSLRTDVPKEGLDTAFLPRAGVSYTNGGSEQFMRTSTDAINALVTQALDKAKTS